jgi:2-polyprenyl-6-methoxyphenol hydroxylase-like FAD-dependent oxidoreductase
VALGDLGGELSPFPYVMTFPQDEHERLLIDLLAREGVTVERRVELTGFVQEPGGVRAELRASDGATSWMTARYIAGCDGAHSAVRAALGSGFVGGTYDHLFYVADVRAHGPMMNGELHVALDTQDLLAVFPLADADGGAGSERDVGRARFIGTIPAAVEARARERTPGWDDVSPDLLRRLHIDVAEVRWFSTYRVHHRVAPHFRHGRAFLLGDAAHVHSPVGGQGMNTGLGDAVNLAWKLAAVLDGRAHESLLDTYEAERIAFARRLVATTDRAFTAASSPTRWARFVRLTLLPLLIPAVFRFVPTRRFMFRTVSQIGIHYRRSAISAGRAGDVHGGDRLPWIRVEQGSAAAGDNHAALADLDWQVHVYGSARGDLREACARRALPLHVFSLPASRRARAGLRRDAVYLVRPDGYVAWADPTADPARLAAFLDRHSIVARTIRAPG